MTIVCVDNIPTMLQFLEETASNAYPRADVQTFLHAKSALEYAENFGCDVLLCEINPPRLEGLFLAEKIKNIRHTAVSFQSTQTPPRSSPRRRGFILHLLYTKNRCLSTGRGSFSSMGFDGR